MPPQLLRTERITEGHPTLLWLRDENNCWVATVNSQILADRLVCAYNSTYASGYDPAGIKALVEAAEKACWFLSHSGNHRPLVGDNFLNPSRRLELLREVTTELKQALAAVKKGE